MLISVLVIPAFYVIGTFAQISGFHFNLSALGKNAGAPLFTLAGPQARAGSRVWGSGVWSSSWWSST